jgi:hypothetical protein
MTLIRWAERRANPTGSPAASIVPDTTEHKIDSDCPLASDWDSSSLAASAQNEEARREDVEEQKEQVEEVASEWDASPITASAQNEEACRDDVQAVQSDEVASDGFFVVAPASVQTEEACQDSLPLEAE